MCVCLVMNASYLGAELPGLWGPGHVFIAQSCHYWEALRLDLISEDQEYLFLLSVDRTELTLM